MSLPKGQRPLAATVMALAVCAFYQPAFAQAPAANGNQVIPYGTDFFRSQQANTVLDMVSRIPGFSLNSGNNVRGLAGAAGNVLIDGQRPISKNDDIESLLIRMPAGSVERIDLIIGGAPGIDMQGYAQVINIIRKPSSKPNLTALFSIKLYEEKVVPSTRLIMSRSGSDRSFEVALLYYGYVNQDESGGERLTFTPQSGLTERLSYDAFGPGEGREIRLSRTQPLWGGKISLNGARSLEHYLQDNDYLSFKPSQSSQSAIGDFSGRYEANELGAQYTRDFGKNINLELNALWRRNPLNERDLYLDTSGSSNFAISAVKTEKLAQAKLTLTPAPGHTVRFGVEGAYNSRRSHSTYSENGIDVPLPSANVLVEEDRSELSAQYIFSPTTKLALETGLKYETSTISESSRVQGSKTLTYPKPRVLATYKLSPKTTFQFRLEREVGQLDFNDFASSVELLGSTIQAGNPDIVPATSWVGEMRFERRWRENALFGLTYQYENISDAVDRVPIVTSSGTFDAPGNIGEGRAQHILADLDLPTEPYGLKGGVLKISTHWRDSEVTDPTTHEKRRLSGQMPFSYSISFRHDILSRRTAWGFSLNTRNAYTTWRVREVTKVKNGDWMQIFAEYKPDTNVSLRMEINNALALNSSRDRDIYNGTRAGGTLNRHEAYTIDSKPMLYFRVLSNL